MFCLYVSQRAGMTVRCICNLPKISVAHFPKDSAKHSIDDLLNNLQLLFYFALFFNLRLEQSASPPDARLLSRAWPSPSLNERSDRRQGIRRVERPFVFFIGSPRPRICRRTCLSNGAWWCQRSTVCSRDWAPLKSSRSTWEHLLQSRVHPDSVGVHVLQTRIGRLRHFGFVLSKQPQWRLSRINVCGDRWEQNIGYV